MVKEEETAGTPMPGATPAATTAGNESSWDSDGQPALAISDGADNTRKSCPGPLAYCFNRLRLESDDATAVSKNPK